MSENALDPPPVRRARPKRRPIAVILAGVVIAVGVIFAVLHFMHPADAGRGGPGGRGGFDRTAFAGGGPTPEPPPAVSESSAAAMQANLQAMQRAADSPALKTHPVQVAAVSPPAGAPARGLGVTHSTTQQVGPSDG